MGFQKVNSNSSKLGAAPLLPNVSLRESGNKQIFGSHDTSIERFFIGSTTGEYVRGSMRVFPLYLCILSVTILYGKSPFSREGVYCEVIISAKASHLI
jgi:hypothetical protein